MSPLLKLALILLLPLLWKALHMFGVAIVDRYGLLGSLAACAIFFSTSLIIDR